MRAIYAPRQSVLGVSAVFLLLLLGVTFGHPAHADVARPPGTGTGPVVANVHLLGGSSSQIRAGGRAFPAAVGLPLLASDEMVVPLGEFLLVALSNGHLVRIDEDITLRVSEIVLLGVPPTRESLTAQLDRLVTKQERVLSERISGVQARRQAADELPVETSDARKKTPAKPASRALAVQLDTSTAQGAPPPPPPPPPPSIQPPPQPMSRSLPEAELAKPPGAGASVKAEARLEKKSPTAIQLPKQSQAKKCLESALLPTITRVTIEVKIHAGHITAVRLRGGLVTPACMPRLLLKRALQGPEETWLGSELVLH